MQDTRQLSLKKKGVNIVIHKGGLLPICNFLVQITETKDLDGKLQLYNGVKKGLTLCNGILALQPHELSILILIIFLNFFLMQFSP